MGWSSGQAALIVKHVVKVKQLLEDLARLHPLTCVFHGVKLQNTPWSSGQGLKTAVKNLDPGRKREYSKYGSDLPLYGPMAS